jgi:hypothetical protein
MAKAVKSKKRFMILLRPNKKDPEYREAVFEADYCQVNGRGDMELYNASNGIYNRGTVACFASGSWLSVHGLPDTEPV